MDQDQQRDHAEERYWRHYCPEHDTSHMTNDGRCPDAEGDDGLLCIECGAYLTNVEEDCCGLRD